MHQVIYIVYSAVDMLDSSWTNEIQAKQRLDALYAEGYKDLAYCEKWALNKVDGYMGNIVHA